MPVGSVPIRSAVIVFPLDWTLMPEPWKLAMFRPVIVLPPDPAPRISPSNACRPPLICTPGSVAPFSVTGTAMAGRTAVGLITNGALPGMAKVMSSVPDDGGLLFASRIACRSEPTSEPGTLSVVFVTWKGEASPTLVANAEVSLAAEVAVAVTVWPNGIGVARLRVAVKLCGLADKAGVVTDPRNWAAGLPRTLLAKNLIVYA